MKLPSDAQDPINRFIANRFRYLADYASTTLAYLTWRRTGEVDASDALEALTEGFELQDRGTDRPIGIRPQEWKAGSQREVLEHLYAAFISHPLGARKMMVTGDAGVGKSVILRQLAARIATDVLSGLRPNRPVPIFFPLQQLRKDDL